MHYLEKKKGAEISSMSTSRPRWLEIVIEGYQRDNTTKALLSELALTGSNADGFLLQDGIIKYNGRI